MTPAELTLISLPVVGTVKAVALFPGICLTGILLELDTCIVTNSLARLEDSHVCQSRCSARPPDVSRPGRAATVARPTAQPRPSPRLRRPHGRRLRRLGPPLH